PVDVEGEPCPLADGSQVLPSRRERTVEGHAVADLQRVDTPRRERSAEEVPVEGGHRPRPAVAHAGGQVQPAGPGPARAAVVAIDLRERERPGVELAVVDGHPHDLLLLPQTTGRDPALAAIEPEHLPVRPRPDEELPRVDL